MPRAAPLVALASLAPAALAACGGPDPLPLQAGFGPNPVLPPPQPAMVSTVNIAPARGWAERAAAARRSGFAVERVRGRPRPPALALRPAQRRRAGRRDQRAAQGGRRRSGAWAHAAVQEGSRRRHLQRRTGSRCCATRDGDGSRRDPDRLPRGAPLALRDGPGRGRRSTSPTPTPCSASPTRRARRAIAAPGTELARPAGRPDQPPLDREPRREPRRLEALRRGRLEQQRRRERHGGRGAAARAILEIDRATGRAARLRLRPAQPDRHGLEPATGALWTVVNERDELGDDLVPDYLTVGPGGRLLRLALQLLRPARRPARRSRQRPTSSRSAIVPDYALGAHTASLGLAFYDGDAFPDALPRGRVHRPARLLEPLRPQRLQGDLRAVPRRAPAGMPEDVLTGFLAENGDALGRPVGVAIDQAGALLVADDVGNVVWRVTSAEAVTSGLRPGAP